MDCFWLGWIWFGISVWLGLVWGGLALSVGLVWLVLFGLGWVRVVLVWVSFVLG